MAVPGGAEHLAFAAKFAADRFPGVTLPDLLLQIHSFPWSEVYLVVQGLVCSGARQLVSFRIGKK
jgi:hypothetical protein